MLDHLIATTACHLCGHCDECLGFDQEKNVLEMGRCDGCDAHTVVRTSGPDGMPAVLALCGPCEGTTEYSLA